MRRIQSVFVALVVLAISAGAVFAGRALSEASGSGLDRAAAAAGWVVPSTGDPARQASPTPTPTPTAAVTSVTLAQPAGTDEITDATTGQHPDNHGAIVSAAAHLSFEDLKTACSTTFEGKNKGAYISAIARGLLEVTAPDATGGTTPTITCAWPARDATSGTSAAGTANATAATAAPTAAPTAGPTPTAPGKLHGKVNADAWREAHGKPSH